VLGKSFPFSVASTFSDSSATGFVLSSAAFSGFDCSSADSEGGSVVAVRCQAGIEGLDMVSFLCGAVGDV
jgi:hypothetical protein